MAVRAEKHRQQIDDLCGASLRALSATPQLRYRGNRLEAAGRPYPVRAPHLHPDTPQDDFASFRGVADSLALRVRHNDPRTQQRYLPDTPIERLVFDLLEQLRVESLVTDEYPGVRRNLRHRFEAWSQQFLDSGQLDNHLGLMLFTLSQMGWRLLCNGPLSEHVQDLIEAPRMYLNARFGADFGQLRESRDDPPRFARLARAIAGRIRALVDDLEEEAGSAKPQRKNEAVALAKAFAIVLEQEETDGEAGYHDANSQRGEDPAHRFSYRVFCPEYDREMRPERQIRPELLRQLRQRLDTAVTGARLNLPRLAKQLRGLLAAPRLQGWAFAQEEGRLDASRLSRLVTSPHQRDLFRREPLRPHTDCVVSFLVDNSGSMRAHIETLAVLIDGFCRALEMAGARSEVLGFTTNQWNGGRPFKRWRGQGSPANPGRLNETCHLIYKDADTSWRRARPAIASLLKSDLFREGIDGEALLWAHQRLRQRSESRRLLVVISDGCPMDSTTHQANDEDILDLHLRQVARQIEHEGSTELYALGVGLDLSTYYRTSLELDLQRGVDNVLLGEVLTLLTRTHRALA